jgi:HlyD family secretion protein
MKSTTPAMRFLAIAAMLLTLCGCREQDPNLIQGYVEGEYVYVAAPYAASLEKLAVHRGQQIDKDVELFALDSRPQKAALDEADRRLAQARATLEDLRKGRRPTEIESLAAMLEQAQASLVRNKVEYDRIEKLEKSGASSTEELDAARSARDQDRARVTQLEADLKTANLGSREDQIAAAEATVKAQEAMLVKAEWDLSQMKQSSTKAGLVFDTLYREGEWVAAGRPVVMLLPPANIKVRAFVPEPRIGELKLGDQLEVLIDGVEKPFVGKVSYISAKAEYTPPIIYSRQSRSKLVFMIELTFDPEVAAELHPGQPLDVRLK